MHIPNTVTRHFCGELREVRSEKVWCMVATRRKESFTYTRKVLNLPTISKLLAQEGMTATREGIHRFLVKFTKTGSLLSRPGSGRPSKITQEIMLIVEE